MISTISLFTCYGVSICDSVDRFLQGFRSYPRGKSRQFLLRIWDDTYAQNTKTSIRAHTRGSTLPDKDWMEGLWRDGGPDSEMDWSKRRWGHVIVGRRVFARL